MYIYNYNNYIELHLNILIERTLITNTLNGRLLSRPDNPSIRILEVCILGKNILALFTN